LDFFGRVTKDQLPRFCRCPMSHGSEYSVIIVADRWLSYLYFSHKDMYEQQNTLLAKIKGFNQYSIFLGDFQQTGNLRQKQQSKNCSLWCFLAILAKLMNSKLRGTRKNKSQRFKIFRSKRSLRRKFFRREPLIVAYREYFAVSKTLL
ncbi:hypothetical protein PV325_002252, partial [Microctonus aethiopoides]